MLRVAFAEMKAEFERVLLKVGFDRERAELCARLFAETSRDGVYTHGLNRFPGFIADIKKGRIKIEARPEKTGGFGAVESWNGNLGPGNLNATLAMRRAVELARANGMGCVAMQNTNHWMRGGTYGWQAAEAGCIGICWTNTSPLMPPWGSSENKLGNNPLVLAVPHRDGHIVLDMAMTVFSIGKLNSAAAKGALLPVDGGFDEEGKVTRDPQRILQSKRPMPIGYWKGSGLALLLDLIGMMLSGGSSTFHLGQAQAEDKPGVSQVFIAFDPAQIARPDYEALITEILNDLHGAKPVEDGEPILYPGERALKVRRENLEKGIPVEENFWQQVLEM
jgi:3-dehydro-L-gulonate 2-dehydrogenase